MGIEAALIAVAVVSTAVSIDQGNKSRKAQEKARQEQRAQTAEESAKERRQQIREERVRRARMLQSAENSGVADSSGEVGALASLSTGLSENLGFSLNSEARGNAISDAQQNAANAAGRAQTSQAIGSLATSIFGQLGKTPDAPKVKQTKMDWYE